MRKLKRSMLRAEAEKNGIKPSKYVKEMWNRLQIKQYGIRAREANMLKGTHSKSVWRTRLQMTEGR